MSTEIGLLFVAGVIVVLVAGALDARKRRRRDRRRGPVGGTMPLGHGHGGGSPGGWSDGGGSGGPDGCGSGGDSGGGGG